MALDHRGRVAGNGYGFNHIRVEGPLRQELGIADLLLRFFEDFDEGIADNHALLFGLGYPGQAAQENIGGILVVELDIEIFAEDVADAVALIGPEESVIDEDAGQLIADGFMEQYGRHAGIHPAGEAQDDMLLADLSANLLNRHLAVGTHGPGFAATTNLMDEIAQNLLSPGSMGHFRVELESIEAALAVFHSGVIGVIGHGHSFEAGGQMGHLVAVGIPDLDFFLQRLEKRAARILNPQDSLAVFTADTRLDLAAQGFSQELQTVADTEHRHLEVKDSGIRLGGIGSVNTGRAAREDDPPGFHGGDLRGRSVERLYKTIDLTLADAASDNLCIL